MRPGLVLRLAALLLCVLPAAAAAATGAPAAAPAAGKAPERRIAISIDDLPWASFGTPSFPDAYHPRLMQALRDSKAPVTGFVNEGKLGPEGAPDPARRRMLEDWLDAGAELGNHTFGHVDLHAVGLAAYQADILRGERVLRPMLGARGAAPRWFRHPYLRAGRSADDKARLAAFLAEHGYRIAPVTVDTSDWIWAAAYRKAIAAGDAAAQARLREDYVPYMLAKVDYYQRQSLDLLGYNLPQVLLMHANELNADTYAALVQGLRARGYGIVGLDEALRDPAYARADAYTGRWGPSWLHRWALGADRPALPGEPTVAPWVMQLAGVDSE